MTTATDAEMRVVMDESIRQSPELLRAARTASHFLDDFVLQHLATFGHDRVLAWQHQPDHYDGERVGVRYSEQDDLGVRSFQLWLTPKDLSDPVRQRNGMRDLLQGILAQRRKQSDARIARYLTDLDETGG